MREIKFRAVRFFKDGTCDMDYSKHWKSLGEFISFLEVNYRNNHKLLAYTGLKDKNGREIYEGDIISTDLDRPFNIVVFRNGAFMFQCHDSGKDYYDYMFSVEEESDRLEYGEVIGNIFEHKHLLGEAK